MDDKRLEHLLASQFDQSLTTVEQAELEDLLLKSPEARARLAEAAAIEVDLTTVHGHPMPAIPEPPKHQHRPMLWFLAAAACALLAGGISWQLTSGLPTAERVVLLDTVAPVWTGASPDARATDAGHYHLETGLAHLYLHPGVDVILEGPCDFEVPRRGHCVLTSGRLFARIAPGAEGFTVRTPHGQVVDLSTSFGLTVDSEKSALHVIDGRVAAMVGDNEIVVGAGSAVRFGAAGTFASIPHDPDPFWQQLPTGRSRHLYAASPIGFWDFEQSDLSVGRFAGTTTYGKTIGNPAVTSDSFAADAGKALMLSGDAAVDLACAPQFERNEPFSISVWFQPAEDVVHNRAILSQMDGNFRGWDLFWMGGNQISVHVIHQWDQGGGRINNSLRLHTTTQFKPGDWHHIVFTHDGSGRAEGCHIFVNGVDQPTKTTHNSLTRTIVSDATIIVGKRPPRFHDPNTPPIRGSIDEVAIFDRQLTPAEVAQLYREPIQ